MQRGSLLLIGIASAIATIISLNMILGRSWNYERYSHGRRWYNCDEHYKENTDQKYQRNHGYTGSDSATGKY